MSQSPTIPERMVPRVAVWEVTLACNARCVHCGSDAGQRRDRELSTGEALDVVRQLANLGCRFITLSGGEPLMRQDWPELVALMREVGIRPELITNGLLVAAQASRIAEAGFSSVSFSIDGPESVHDGLRGAGAFRQTMEGARHLRRLGVRIGAVTQVARDNFGALDATHEVLAQAGFEGWQIQLTLPTGRAPPSMCLGPGELPALEESVVRQVKRGCMHVIAADTIGWFSVHEPVIRTGNPTAIRVWAACQAGLQAVAITSDGSVRGCLAMPPVFNEGNLRDSSLASLWNRQGAFAYNRQFDRAALRGACAACAFAGICRAGCTCLAWLATGTTLDNPYCTRSCANRAPAPLRERL